MLIEGQRFPRENNNNSKLQNFSEHIGRVRNSSEVFQKKTF